MPRESCKPSAFAVSSGKSSNFIDASSTRCHEHLKPRKIEVELAFSTVTSIFIEETRSTPMLKTLRQNQLQQAWSLFWEAYPNERKAHVDLLDKVKYSFSDEALLFEALTHRSATESQRSKALCRDLDIQLPWNERLEFLGDSVLGLVLSSALWKQESFSDEGRLSRLRSQLVNEMMLAKLAKDIGLNCCLALGKGEQNSGGSSKDSILADCFEAFLGAIYLDSSFAEVERVLLRLFEPLLARIKNETFTSLDYKSELQELAQERYKEAPIYRTVGVAGPSHRREFQVGAYLRDRQLAIGVGSSKKRASQDAARKSMIVFSEDING